MDPRKHILHRSPDPRAKGQLLGERTGPSYLRTVCSKCLVVYVANIVMYFFTAALRIADVDIIFLPCGFFFLSSFFFLPSPNLSGRRLDVYHTSTHCVALVRI